MNDLKLINIEAVDIPDAWFQCLYHILDYGFKYTINQGSFAGDTRFEYDWVTVYIKYPYNEPWDTMLPQIPPHLSIPNPVERGYVEQYLPYLMTDYKEPEESYTYGSRLCHQIEHIIELLKKTPQTNQAVLQIASLNDYLLDDPPCLRMIDCRVKDNQLIFYPILRSWDLWSGFPANLAGIAVLQKYMSDSIGINNGPIICSSKGLHIYSYVEELVKIRTNKK